MPKTSVIDWLLEPDQPSVRYLTLTQVLRRPERDPEVTAAKAQIPKQGWAAEILARREPPGWWGGVQRVYTPKYISSNWNLLALSDLGATRTVPAVRQSAELWMHCSPLKGGGVGGNSNGAGHLCFTGNMARALIKFGYGKDPRVAKAMEWLAATANPKGGWSCWSFSDGPASSRNLDSWEALSAFAVYPRSQWTPAMRTAVERGAEFFLERELYRQGDRYAPWFRFHWPNHYYYDLLVGLDLVTALGYGGDPRLGYALAFLRKRRRADGRWNLDAVHPDVSPRVAKWFKDRPPKDRYTPLAFETPRAPSKMITLRALTVLRRLGEEPAG
jgi:hypothetical protein